MLIGLLYSTMDNDVKFPLMGLLVMETSKALKVRLQSADWQETMRKVINNNVLEKSRSLSSKRYLREIQLRTANAFEWELKFLSESESWEINSIICYLICIRTYNLLSDFYEEVILRKHQQGENIIADYEVRSFMDGKKDIYPRLHALTDTTESRIRSYLIKIFRESGLIRGVREKKITNVDIPTVVLDLYKNNGAGHLLRYIIL